MELYVRDRTCRKAVLRFVREIARTTTLRPEVRMVRAPLDVDFGAAFNRRLTIDWKEPRPDNEGDDFEDDTPSESGTAESFAVTHYQKTIRALADNTEAARAFLELIQGRQRRTGQTADEITG